MKTLINRQKSVVLTSVLSLAITTFGIPVHASDLAQAELEKIPLFENVGEDRLAQSFDECRRISLNRGSLNVRQQPSINSPVIGTVQDKERVSIEGLGSNGWVRISAPYNGYVAADYLRTCVQRVPTRENNCRQVSAKGGLNVRQQPSMNSRTIGQVDNYERVAIESRGQNGWVPISAPLNGFVSADYLQSCNEG